MRNAKENSEEPRAITRATFEVPTDLLVEFRDLAKLNERTFSQEIRKLMADYVERGRAAEKAAA